MHRFIFSLTLATLAILLGGLYVAANDQLASAGDPLKRGAQLYDNWPKLTGAKPEGSHPLYPEQAQKPGAASWRCKECHGWDYLGRDGRYAQGSHYTGIKGTLDQRTRPVDEIRAALVDQAGNHDFSSHLSGSDLDALALFLKEGQFEPPRSAVDMHQGQALFSGNCSSCHGADGQALDFKAKADGVQGVGWLARDNPQETWHKILWGHPGSDMPAMMTDGGLSLTQLTDLQAYCQTLP